MLALNLFVLSGLNAQVKTIYYAGEQVLTDTTLAKTYATSFAIYGKLSNDSLYVFKKYDIYNNLLGTGTYKDEFLIIPHGKFTYYSDVETFNDFNNSSFPYTNKNIFVSEEGNYEDGLAVGEWKSFYPDGKLMAVGTFKNGKKQGKFAAYNAKGILETSGNYVNDKKEGEWIFKRGRKKIFYVNDVEQKKVKGNININ